VINEPRDGRAALEWITAQPWSNDKICMQGGSFVAYTQWAASMARTGAQVSGPRIVDGDGLQ
jgi:predicted acyl esterase